MWGGYLNTDLDTIDTVMKSNFVLAGGSTSAQTGNYTVLMTDRNKLILVDATAGNVTISLLPAATATDGFEVSFKKIDASVNIVTIDGNASETIDGSLTQVLSTQYDETTLKTNATAWFKKQPLGVIKATQADMEAQTPNVYPDASLIKYNPLVAKAIGLFDSNSGSVSTFEYQVGCSSVVRNSIGVYTITLSTPMSSASYIVNGNGFRSGGSGDVLIIPRNRTVSTFQLLATTVSSNPTDAEIGFSVFGDV